MVELCKAVSETTLARNPSDTSHSSIPSTSGRPGGLGPKSFILGSSYSVAHARHQDMLDQGPRTGARTVRDGLYLLGSSQARFIIEPHIKSKHFKWEVPF